MNKKVLIIGGLILTTAIISLIALYSFNHKSENKIVGDNNVVDTVTQVAENNTIEQKVVPLPQEEDVIRLFFELINEKRIPEAISMMSTEMAGDDSQKQAWGVQFNAFSVVGVKSVDKEENGLYKVVLEVEMDPKSAGAVIPFYGYDNGENTRWVSLEKENELYKISGIATGR